MHPRDSRHARHCRNPKHNGRWFGVFVILIGLVLLLKRMSPDFVPHWLLSWPVFLILVGLFIGIRHRFRHFLPFALIIIGSVFLAKKALVIPIDLEQYIWPLAIILVGLIIILRPRNKADWADHTNTASEGKGTFGIPAEQENSDRLDSTAVFCGSRKNILSKNFSGGEMVIVFGGSEINLTQADLNGKAVLDVVIVFGGLKLTVPANWDVRTNVMNVAAGIDDKRQQHNHTPDPEKTLLITGTVLFGGIDIQSY